MICIVLVVSLLLSAFNTAILIKNVPGSELSALHDFYTANNGIDWSWSDPGEIWNFDTEDPNPCHPLWQGLLCSCDDTQCTIVVMYLVQFNIVGTIPESLGNLTNMYSLTLDRNQINGTIPETLGMMHNLTELDLSDNILEGRLPKFLSNATALRKVSLYNNFLSGSLPPQMFNNSDSILDSIELFNNLLTGPLPPIALRGLVSLNVEVNYITGTISEGICNSTYLVSLKLDTNLVHGSIPPCLGRLSFLTDVHINTNSITGAIPEMYMNNSFPGQFAADLNMLTGIIPNSMCNFHPQYLDLGNNSLTGTVPNCLTETIAIIYLSLSYNVFSGTLPSKFLNKSTINILTVDNNVLTGTIPDISRMPSLEFFYVQSNKFSGPLNLKINGTKQDLSFLDVSNNQFTGTLPVELFHEELPLLSFAATSNCFTGSIPRELCNLKLLVFLDLDGLSTGESCRKPLFKNIPLIKSFSLKNQMTGGIPHCLFNMSSLSTLHLSGNSIDWSFPDHLVISDALQTLSLSHNKLTGTIPSYIQQKQWQVLDLSYNKLSGMIMSNWSFYEGINPSLILQVNRLSGGIPKSLLHMPSINILSGNLFGCDFRRTSLPKHDNAYHIYQCGSNTFYQACIVWGACIFLIFVLVVGIHSCMKGNERLRSIRLKFWEYMSVFSNANDLVGLVAFKTHLILFLNSVVGVTMLLLLGILVIYVVLTVHYKTADHQYAWTVSAAFLTGSIPALTLLILFASLIFVLFCIWIYLNVYCTTSNEGTKTLTRSWSQAAVLSTLVFFNCTIMILVNFGYVVVILNYNEVVIFFTQISMALFKLMWNDFSVRVLIVLARRYYGKMNSDQASLNAQNESEDTKYISQEMPFLTFIILFNCIIAPCLATAAVDRNCFYNAFVAAQPVKTEFPIYNCDMQLVEARSCTQYDAVATYMDIAYSPPFIYSYQCSSSILTNYAAVFVFMFLMVAFFKLVVLAVMVSYRNEVPEGSVLHYLMDNTIYKLLKPANVEDVQRGEVLFFKDRFVLRMISKISVLLTFGVIFPPLAGVVCVAFFTETYLNLIMIGRFLCSVEDDSLRVQFRELVCRNVAGFERLLLTPVASLVVPFAALFYGFFVFDTYGDEVGFKQAIWAPVVVVVVPLFIWVCYRLFVIVSGEPVDGKEELIRMSKQRDSVIVNALYADKVM